MVSLYAGLTYPKRLAGIMGHSGFLPLASKFPSALSRVAKEIPILLTYMTEDPIVPSVLSSASAKYLINNLQLKCLDRPFEGDAHSLSSESFMAMYKFTQTVIGSP